MRLPRILIGRDRQRLFGYKSYACGREDNQNGTDVMNQRPHDGREKPTPACRDGREVKEKSEGRPR
jgi:hypothetical protein